MTDDMETIIFEIISNGGNAKGLTYDAIAKSEEGKFEEAEALLKEADESLVAAHKIQTDLIQDEARGKHHEVSVLFVHAQDHLMSALEVRTLSEIIIRQNKRLAKLEEKCNI